MFYFVNAFFRNTMRKILILFLLIQFGCAENDKIQVVDIAQSAIPINGGREIYSNDTIGALTQMMVKGDYIICLDGHPNSQIKFYIIDKRDGKLVSKYGMRGRGPNEYLSPVIIANDNTYNPYNVMDVFDQQNNTYYSLSLDDAHHIRSIREQEKFMHASFDASNYLNRIGNKLLFKGVRPKQELLYKIGDINSGEIVSSAPFFDCSLSIDQSIKGYVYDAKLLASINSDVIIAAMTFFDYVDIYNGKGELTKRYQMSENPLPDMSKDGNISSDSPIFTLKTYCSPDNFYILRRGRDRSSPEQMKGTVEILVFSSKGELTDIFGIDKSIKCFAIDQEGKKLYGTIVDKESGRVSILEYLIAQ